MCKDKNTWLKGALKAKEWLPAAIDQIKLDRTKAIAEGREGLIVIEAEQAELKRRLDHLEYLKRRRVGRY